MLLTSLLAAALLAPVPLQAGAGLATTPQTTPATAEGIEILRRVLADALDDAFQGERGQERVLFNSPSTPGVEGLVTTLWAGQQTVQHARAFHLPGAGLFFALDVSLPVVKKAAEAPTSDQPQDDEWERARRELRGSGPGYRLRALPMAEKVVGEIDPQAIEQATDLVLRTLARHVNRIEGLGAQESVTVALRLSGRDRSWLHEWSHDDPHTIEPGAFELEPDGARGEGARAQTRAFSAYVLATGQEVRDQNLVLQVALADLARAASATPEELRRAARINRY
ncbi:MAG TPA: hypothetical protein VF530_18105 [Planctomycetota bacterium]